MRLVTVGTGTVVPDPDRASACHYVEQGNVRLILDCGAGALQGLARARLPWSELGHLVLSHFHADHIAEIPPLIFALRHALAVPRSAPLHVWGPTGTRRLFEAWRRAYGAWVREPGFELAIQEFTPGAAADLGELTIRATRAPHTLESLALRIESRSSALGYTGDTGPSPTLADFFRGVDLLLAECSLPDTLALPDHLTPARLASLATKAGIARLAVTHVYPQLSRHDIPSLLRDAGYQGEVIIAHDGLELTV